MNVKLMKIKAAVSTLLLIVPQSVFAETYNNQNLINGFAESLSIAGEAITMKVPRNMVLQENKSRVSHEGIDASILVFESDAKFKSKLTYQYESVNSVRRSGHVDQIEKDLRSQFNKVKAHGGKTKCLSGRAGSYYMQRVTFTYFDGEQPKAMTAVAIYDGKHMVTVAAEAGQSSIKKAVAKSKQLARNALSIKKSSGGGSSSLSYLGLGMVIAAVAVVYVKPPSFPGGDTVFNGLA